MTGLLPIKSYSRSFHCLIESSERPPRDWSFKLWLREKYKSQREINVDSTDLTSTSITCLFFSLSFTWLYPRSIHSFSTLVWKSWKVRRKFTQKFEGITFSMMGICVKFPEKPVRVRYFKFKFMKITLKRAKMAIYWAKMASSKVKNYFSIFSNFFKIRQILPWFL